MAGQFDKYVKLLGTGSRPDRYVGAPGNPDIVAPIETNAPSTTPDNTNRSLPANAPKQVAAEKAGKQAADVAFNQKYYGKSSRKRQIEGLKTTTMRLNEKTGEAYDSSEVVPPKAQPVSNLLSKGYVKPNTSAKPADWKEITNPISAEDAERAMANYKPESTKNTFPMPKETASPPTVSETPAPTNQPYNLTTGEVKAEFNDPNSINSTTLSWDARKGEAVETGVRHVSPQFAKVDKIKARRGGTLHKDKDIRDFETEHPDSPASSAATGKTISSANMGTTPYDKAGNVKPEYNDPSTIYSTTMHEHNGEVVEGGVRKAPYTKPPVAKTGNVIPPMAIDTFGSQPTDRKQAEAENKRLRENRVVATRTTVVDPNVLPSRPARGKTPERQAVLAGMREERAASLASEGKTMTTVRPDIMATAKGLGRTSMYNLDNDYMDSPSFLAHEAVQKATVAHALGVHHTLGTDDDHLHRYLGGKPLEAKSRLAAAYKIVDRNLRGNPEKVPGEFALLRGMVHAGSSPQQTLRAARTGKSSDVVVNGQNVTLAEGSSENRQKVADTATNITAQAEAAPKAARLGSIAGSPTAPLAGTGRVAVRRIGQDPEESKIREFSPQERRNLQTNVPTTDDSKRKVGPVEKEVDSDSSSIIDRLKKGPKLNESDN